MLAPADIIHMDPDLAFHTMERMTRNIRTYCPDQEAVRLGMLLRLVSYMMPTADVWGVYLPKHLPSCVPESYKAALQAQLNRVCDPRGTHQFLYLANYSGVDWRKHQEMLLGYRDLLFTNSEYDTESAQELEDDITMWMCEDAKLLWQEFEQKLVTLHNKKRATGQA